VACLYICCFVFVYVRLKVSVDRKLGLVIQVDRASMDKDDVVEIIVVEDSLEYEYIRKRSILV
jgi:hypothetical protein